MGNVLVRRSRSDASLGLPRRQIRIHGHELAYRTAGSGPVLLLLHALSSSSTGWSRVMPALAERHTVVAPDLPGHGGSVGAQSDYSLGAMASTVRDLMTALGHDRATLVGHSLGGGVAMQFAYQYPERSERLVLVSAGGLGPEVAGLLRVLALPGVDGVAGAVLDERLRPTVATVAGWLRWVGLLRFPSFDECWQAYGSLTETETRRAFFRILRSVVGRDGQRISAIDRLYLAARMPTMIVWGGRDRVIPVHHAHAAHAAIPGSTLHVFDDAGHFPHHHDPERFVRAVEEFVRTTKPARLTADDIRALLHADRSRGPRGADPAKS